MALMSRPLVDNQGLCVSFVYQLVRTQRVKDCNKENHGTLNDQTRLRDGGPWVVSCQEAHVIPPTCRDSDPVSGHIIS